MSLKYKCRPLRYVNSFSFRPTPLYSIKIILLFGFWFFLFQGLTVQLRSWQKNFATEIIKKNQLKIINHTNAEVMKGLVYSHKSREEKGKNQSWNYIFNLKFLVIATYFLYRIITFWQVLLYLNTFGWAKDEVSF